MTEATAIAHPNVALSKYWGKREGQGNFPAVPSLSVTLEGLTTRTRVRWGASRDRIVLDGRELSGDQARRATALLDRVRSASGRAESADVESINDFPTASGLASSASGFAALALAAVRSADLDWDAARTSDLARSASASAARSLFGGFVELPVGEASARAVAPRDHLRLLVLVCVTTEQPKAMGSTEAMNETMRRSPYARAWLEEAPKIHARLREAVIARDFDRAGELAESSALAMHASAMAAGIVYFNATTLALIDEVRALRRAGHSLWATIDAGPHVKVLVQPAGAQSARAALGAVPGVVRVIEARPGEGARIE